MTQCLRCFELLMALADALEELEDVIPYKSEYLVKKHGNQEALNALRAIYAKYAPASQGEEHKG